MKRFKMAPDIYYEEGAVKYLYGLEYKRAFIITDQTMIKIGLAKQVTDILDEKRDSLRVLCRCRA